MAITAAADVAAQIPQIWSTELFAQAENQTFWQSFEGAEGSSSPIIRKDDLTAEAGDTIKTDIVLALTGAGQTGDTSFLEGNEEALKFRQQSFTVASLQHAVLWTKLGKILINHDMRNTAKNQLAKWLAGKLDDKVFNELTGNGSTTMPTANKWAAGTATSRDTVANGAATGQLTFNDITEMKAYAQVALHIEPITIENGEEYFIFVGHPYAYLPMKESTEWKDAQKYAQERSKDNPLFSGALGMYDGVIFYSSNRIPRSNNAASPVIAVADNVFLGAQALSRGYGYYPDWTEEYFSYGEKQGIATWTLVGQKLNVFDLTSGGGASANNLTAIGSMVVYSSAVAPGQP